MIGEILTERVAKENAYEGVDVEFYGIFLRELQVHKAEGHFFGHFRPPPFC